MTLAALGCDQGVQVQALRERATELELTPLETVEEPDAALVGLGRNLFFDPILSGNRDQACATCHAPEHALGDGRSLAVGTASVLRDGERVPGPDHTFTPRNAPSLWDLGQVESTVLFWDGRLAPGEDGDLVMYETGHDASGVVRLFLPSLLESAVSAQPMLPVLDRDEMRGEVTDEVLAAGENELARISDLDFAGVWDALVKRLLEVEGYQDGLSAAFPGVQEGELGFEHAALAIGAFLGSAFQATDTPWDRFLAGDELAMDAAQVRGALLFYGDGTCWTCHSGALFTDQELYNLGVRPMTSGPSELESVDLGAAHRTHTRERYTFRTPRLRNVALTGPWMHNGAYTSLRSVLEHKRDPVGGLWDYDGSQLEEVFRAQVHRDEEVLADVEEHLTAEVSRSLPLTDGDLEDLEAFLSALSSPAAVEVEALVPLDVPSGLPIPLP